MVLAMEMVRPDAPATAGPRHDRMVRVIVVAVFCGITLAGLVGALSQVAGLIEITISCCCLLALLQLQVFWFSRPASQLRTRRGVAALMAQACLVYLPMIWLGRDWQGLPGLLAGNALLVLPPAAGWALFAAVATSMGVIYGMLGGASLDVAYASVSTVATGLVVYGLYRLTTLIAEMHETRAELARKAAVDERVRFARDLHDLLSYSLSAITLKAELAQKLVTQNSRRASGELDEILDITRQALADVRAMATGYRALSLDDECRAARSILAAAEIDVRMDVTYDDLPLSVSMVLAAVLREGVVNTLRHSKAEQCEVRIRQTNQEVRIELVNDGVRRVPDAAVSERGSGLGNLAIRAAEIGGRLTAEPVDGDAFRLRVAIPLSADPSSACHAPGRAAG